MKTLDLAEFEQVVVELKEDLQREANQFVLKRDVHAAAASLAAIEAVDRLQHRVIARMYSLGEPEAKQVKNLKQFKRSRLPEASPVVRKRIKVGKVREITPAVGE